MSAFWASEMLSLLMAVERLERKVASGAVPEDAEGEMAETALSKVCDEGRSPEATDC